MSSCVAEESLLGGKEASIPLGIPTLPASEIQREIAQRRIRLARDADGSVALPTVVHDEAFEVSKIYSVTSLLSTGRPQQFCLLVTDRPMRPVPLNFHTLRSRRLSERPSRESREIKPMNPGGIELEYAGFLDIGRFATGGGTPRTPHVVLYCCKRMDSQLIAN